MQLCDMVIICGHYGCGKTNFAINLASDFAAAGEKVTLVDLDVVNPYFRSSDYAPLIEKRGIRLLAPNYAHSNLDLPSLPAEMYSIFTVGGRVIIDAGGDDAGATALGGFSARIKEREYSMLYVINKFRALSRTPQEAAELLGEIELASRLKASGIVNNSHLCDRTTADDILSSAQFAQDVSALTGLPLEATTVEKRLLPELEGRVPDIYPVSVLVTKPWETTGE